MMVLDKINPPTNVWFLSGDHTTEGKKAVSNVTKELLGKGAGWVQKSSPDLWLVSWNLIRGGGWQVFKSGKRTSDEECRVSTTGLGIWGYSRCWCGGAWCEWAGETGNKILWHVTGPVKDLLPLCSSHGNPFICYKEMTGSCLSFKKIILQQWGEKTGRGSSRPEIVHAAVIQVNGRVECSTCWALF